MGYCIVVEVAWLECKYLKQTWINLFFVSFGCLLQHRPLRLCLWLECSELFGIKLVR